MLELISNEGRCHKNWYDFFHVFLFVTYLLLLWFLLNISKIIRASPFRLKSTIRKYNFDINIFRIYIKYAGYRGDEERAKIARKHICKRKRKKETEFEPSL